MRKVLVVSYYYAPYPSAGAVRISKFARYLPEFGWMPIVLTAESQYSALPLESEAPVFRTRQINLHAPLSSHRVGQRMVQSARLGFRSSLLRRLSRLARAFYRQVLAFPDSHIGWYPFALSAGRRIIEKAQPDVIFSSSVPATSHLVAARLAATSGIPWVADLRDLWTDSHRFRRVQPLLSLERLLERRVLGRAEILVTVSQPLAEQLIMRIHRPVAVVTNGYDPSDYPADVVPLRRFTLTFLGTYYPDNYDAAPLFGAIHALHKAGLITPQSFELRFIGQSVEVLKPSVEEYGLKNLVKLGGIIPHQECLRRLTESAALIFLPWQGPHGEGVYTSKLFEYIGAGRPILSIGRDANIAVRLIESSRFGVHVQTAAQVEAVLREWMREFALSGTIQPGVNVAERAAFTHRRLSEQLAGILTEATT